MKRNSMLILGLALLPAMVSAQDNRSALMARYSSIAPRNPFGIAPPPPPVAPPGPQTPAPTPEELAFARDMRVVYIRRNVSDGKLRVGIADNRTKASDILYVGDTSETLNITLVDANYDDGKAVVKRGNIQQEIFAGDSAPAAPAVPGRSPASPRPTYVGMTRAERLKRREEAMRKIREEAEKPPRLTGDELQKHLEDYQMELIRSGGEKGPPLPLPLTPEMDDQLVKEGVLPP